MGYGIMSPIIDIKSVTKKYVNGEGNTLTVLDNISLSVETGSFLCILGPSGCGKTTLLKLIGGFEAPTSGELYIEDSPITKPGIDRSMVFQTFEQLLPWKTVGGNIEYPLKVNKIGNAAERMEIVHKYLSLVGLEKFINYYPHQISGGMKQRVAIARSLAQKPKVILMDEPFASLDAQTRNSLQEELYKIWKQTNVTIIFITHNIQEAIVLGSNIVVMSKSPANICLQMENTVDSSKGIRFPGSKGYDECWKLLHDEIVSQSKG
jgi:NitT/TauT family transport system ATP-binding protein